MASRLYASTRGLFDQVLKVLVLLGLGSLMSVLAVNLVCLYICGLILLDKHQTNCRIARWLPGRCHDALNRLLRVMNWSAEALMDRLIEIARGLGPGYVILDDVVVEKFGTACVFVGYCWSTSRKKVVLGLHIVVLVWCSLDGRYRIPVGFAIWKPEGCCQVAGEAYRTKKELGKQLIVRIRQKKLSVEYICFDTWYGADWFFTWLTRRGMIFNTGVACNRHGVYRGQEQRVDELAPKLTYHWDKHLQTDVASAIIELPGYGRIKLVVTREAKGVKNGSIQARTSPGVKDDVEYAYEYTITNALTARARAVVRQKQSRWCVETVLRDEKQYGGLGACQCRMPQAVQRHVALSCLCFVVLQWLRQTPEETLGHVKERWQLEALRQGQPEPEPLRGPQKVTLEATA